MKKIMLILKCFFYAVLLASALSTAAQYENPIVTLENQAVTVKINLNMGGRVVFLSCPGGENIMLADPAALSADANILLPAAEAPVFKEYNGHITWLAPKSDWWFQQNVNSEYKAKRKTWPPDPFIIYGRYKVLKKDNSSLVILGPSSPVSGIQMKKIIKITDGGKVIFTVIIKNVSQSKRRWGIWSNTRLPGKAVCLASIDNSRMMKVGGSFPANGKDRNLTFFIERKYFSFINKINWKSYQARAYSKAGFCSRNGAIFAFNRGNMFVKRFPLIDAAKVSPGHYPVEIFLKLHNASRSVDMLELENHGEYTVLVPGQETSLTETWEVLPFAGKTETTSYLNAIEQYWEKHKTQLHNFGAK